jgi:hypothetical protein
MLLNESFILKQFDESRWLLAGGRCVGHGNKKKQTLLFNKVAQFLRVSL